MSVLRKADIPQPFHYKEHRRIPPILALAEEGWTIARRQDLEEGRDQFPKGMHGYDPRLPSMQGIFIARGPAFRRGVVVEPFENIHIYSLMTHILGLEAASNDGDLNAVRGLLADE